MEAAIDTLPIDKLRKLVADGAAHLDKAIEIFSFLVSLTSEERQHSNGRMRNGEEAALTAVIDTVSNHPQIFSALKLDAKALKSLLERRDLLTSSAERARHLADDLTDTQLHLGEAVKTPILTAYHLGVAVGSHDPALASGIQPARQFYQAPARAGARTRKAHQAAGSGQSPTKGAQGA